MKKMIIWKEFTFDSSHRLLGYNGACANLHGHTWKVQLGYCGELKPSGSDRGMIADFNDIKKAIKEVMNLFDHALILEQGDELLNVFSDHKVMVMEHRPTVENMATLMMEITKCDAIRMWETPTSFVEIL